MRLISTRDTEQEAPLRTAVLGGPAPNGGLYLPVDLPRITEEELRSLEGGSFAATAEYLAGRILEPTLSVETVRRMVASAFDFPLPLVPLGRSTWVLELFHGPTGSFKDFGARFLARLLSVLRDPEDGPVVILVATSGDTGGAVADAVRGLEGVRAVVLYPQGRLSPVQLRQIQVPAVRNGSGEREAPGLAQQGVVPVEVRGSFDDCQRMVKDVLNEPGPGIDSILTSANSVNVGRLIPQTFYYVHGWNELPADRAQLTVSVPSGNLGNLTAGILATRMGLPVRSFVAASNANAAMSRFFESGAWPDGQTLETLSSAMDVARPNNLERLVTLFDGDVEELRRTIAATTHEDDAVLETIARVHREQGYLMDPHTAVGYLGLEEQRRQTGDAAPGMILATADPAKFPATIERAIGRRPPRRSDWEEEGISQPTPPARSEESTIVTDPDSDALREILKKVQS